MLTQSDYYEIHSDLGLIKLQLCNIHDWLCGMEPDQIEGVRRLKEAVDSLIAETEHVRADIMSKYEACDE